MSRRKQILSILCATGLAALIVAGSAPAKPSDSVALNMSMLSTWKPAFDILIPNFERVYPNIQINVTYAPNATQQQLLLTQLQAGSPPDLMYVTLGNQTLTGVKPLASSGHLLNLTGAPWDLRIPASLKSDALQYNGKTYAYPFTTFVFGVMYNADLMKQLGVKVPTTFSQVLALCQAVKSAGKVAFELPLANLSSASILQRVAQYVYAQTPNWNTLRDKHRRSFRTTTGWARSFQSILDMNNAGCFQPGPEATTSAQGYALIAQGQALGALMTSGEAGAIKALNPNINLAMYNMPGDTPDQNVVETAGSALAASVTTSHPTEAKEFIQFLSRPKQAALFATIGGGISYYDLIKGNLPSILNPMIPLVKAGKVLLSPSVSFASPVIATPNLANMIVALLLGRTTIHDVLVGLDYLWDNPTATAAP